MGIVKAKKYLGQHFLKDQNIARKITDSLLPLTTNVLEIGPGMGVLTQYLLKNNRFSVLAIDIDQESISYLHEAFPQQKKQIIYGDFLKMDLTLFQKEPFSIIGNLPYNISSQIFFRVIENRDYIPQVVCMIQKEVADRISASHGIEYLFTVNEQVFDPPPKVKSAVIRLTRNRREKLDCKEQLFFNVVKTGFNQRRKTLRNSLKPILPPEFTSDMLNLRPEQLSAEDFITLCKAIENNL